MRSTILNSILNKSGLAASALLLSGAALAQQAVNLTAASSTAVLPDGTAVPMWGYGCGATVAGSTASCAPLNPSVATTGGWSPVVITVPSGQDLQINLTNNLVFTFTPAGSTTAVTNAVPTSLTIVGQLGGGLGSAATYAPSPVHAPQSVTWATAGNSAGAQFNPPLQLPRVQSFATEVAAVAPGSTTAATTLTWKAPQPGTYLIESGTHPSIQGPMGLYGILVVTQAPAAAAGTETAAGVAYPGVSYDAEVPIILSEIDPIQNNAVNAAVNTVNFDENAVVVLRNSVSGIGLTLDSNGNVVNAGKLYNVGDTFSITGGGGAGAIATVTSIGTGGTITGLNVTAAGAGYTSVPTGYVLTSAGPNSGSGASLTAVLSLAGDACVSAAYGPTNACYPPAVNYTPKYFLMNGAAFNKTNALGSLFPVAPANINAAAGTKTTTGTVLVRLVNAGLRMHVPAIVGSQTGAAAIPPTGFALIAEDGNPLPGVARVQSEVFMAAGKTYDVMINAPAPVAGATTPPALPIYDRELSLSGNATARDAGMLAYIGINGGGVPAAAAASAVARPDIYNSVLPCASAPCPAITVSDPGKGLIANDTNVYGVKLVPGMGPAGGTLTLNANGTFTYVPNPGTTSDSFTYMANGNPAVTATVTLGACTGTCTEAPGAITVNNISYTSNVATFFAVPPPGILSVDSDSKGFPLSVVPGSAAGSGFATLTVNANGSFNAAVPGAGTYTFTYKVQNSQGTVAASTGTVTVVFPQGSGLTVKVLDPTDTTHTPIGDYRWIIEEDKTFWVDPGCTTNPVPVTSATSGQPCLGYNSNVANAIVPDFGTNFHTSDMPFVAQGCTGPVSCEAGQTVFDPASGSHVPAVCDLGNGACRPDTAGTGHTAVMPGSVHLDPTKRYYISVLPGDAANPFTAGYSNVPCSTPGAPANCVTGHGMGGTSIAFGQLTANVTVQPSPYPPGELSVFVFEDDFPLNGEVDSGGGLDVLAPYEPGLGGFQIHLWDAMGGNGDFTGQMTYDMFNQPLTNGLDGNLDPVTGFDACPITKLGLNNSGGSGGITGMIVTCPKYEYNPKDPSAKSAQILSPLAGQAVIKNLMPGRWGVIATPAADRIARGEEWHQTNTLDGQKAHDSFVRIGEPEYFQEYGPANFHVTIGFANPAIINARLAGVCAGTDPNLSLPAGSACNNSVSGIVTTERMSRTPDERLYSSGTHDSFYWTQCYVSFGDPDGEDFAFTKCNADGTWKLTGLPPGTWRVTVFDQWNDMLVDGLSTPVALANGVPVYMGEIASNQWQANIYTRTCIDANANGICEPTDTGIPFNQVNVRYRDGSLANNLQTDFTGTANFNEEFPLFNWYVVETDVTRYKSTGTHSVYDTGGPADGTAACTPATGQTSTGYPPCGNASANGNPYKFLANTAETVSVPDGTNGTLNLRVPGAVYCKTADCYGKSIQSIAIANPSDPASQCTITGTTNGSNGVVSYNPSCTTLLSTGRIDPPWLAGTEGYQGFSGENNFLEFGKEPYNPGENGGIKGHVVYASTRPFDDPQMLVQLQWEPLVPHVTLNLYQEGTAPDGTQSLTLVDTTTTSSWDDWAQGFHKDAKGNVIPNMSCPGQSTSDLFYFTLQNQPNYLDVYNNVQHGTASGPTPLPYNSQFKCYDGLHSFNQLQPAPYDGMYAFPSVTTTDPTTGKPTGTNCTICKPNTAANPGDLYLGMQQLPPGKYVVEVVLPPGYELVKEEDKNILIGDDFIAPVTQQFGALGNIFIIPDQASIASPGPGFPAGSGGSNPNNAQNPTNSLGAVPEQGFLVGFSPEPNWPCVGQARIVPDYISLFPQSAQVAPFAGATRPLCDRKEVTLTDQSSSIAKFYIFTSTHRASKYTGVITDDFTSEFDPFSPQFGEKFSPPNMPVSVKDWTGAETSRVYADQWGTYNGMTYSTWEVNPPNPTGYSPTMMVFCMNDPGSGATPDPLFNPLYSQFCYELPFMPAQTQYLDTPVVPTAAYVGAGYNNPDCAYPAYTPAISEVDGDGAGLSVAQTHVGPWVNAPGATLTVTALGDQSVQNYGYSGPSIGTAPFNQKTITRHYGFGSTQGTVSIGGKSATVVQGSWSDASFKVTVPSGVPQCAVQQQEIYGAPTQPALCGQLLITASNGQQSIDTVTVTIGGKQPTYVTSTAPLTQYGVGAIQQAIDAAAPGDLIMIPPGVYNEMLVMWKPLRLQGVGAASTVINANTQPAGKLDPWRAEVSCMFGLARNGTPIGPNGTGGTNAFDPTNTFTCPNAGSKYFTGTESGGTPLRRGGFSPVVQTPQVDRLPLEGIVGWDTTTNGNLAQLLQEPTLMGAYEGAGITVLSKGVNTLGQSGYYGSGNEAAFPTGTLVLTSGDCLTRGHNAANPYPSNFQCNPSSIDGLSVTDSSQGGGGIFVHAWAHNLQIANDRVYNNIGTLSGGINVGQGESPDAYLAGSVSDTDPGSCESSNITNQQLPYCFDLHLNVHNNMVTSNTSIGDELFSGTPAGAGGVSFCTGADYYQFNYNWLCGNMSTGDGGGFAHVGFIKNGDIEHNWILFNQSTNPTIATNGGGLIVMGAAPDGLTASGIECGSTVADLDCPPGVPDGTGPNLKINANLILGNSAASGSGGGVRFQSVNGTDISLIPNQPLLWNSVMFTNNIVVNNVAGWDGGGISLQDSLNIDIINNTIASNDTTASAGVLFNTIGAPDASAPGATNQTTGNGTTSAPQPAGLVSMQNSPVLVASLAGIHVTCPPGHAGCAQFSNPYLANDLFWQNRAFYIGVGSLSAAYQQNIISMFNAVSGSPVGSQPKTASSTANGAGTTITGGTGSCVNVSTSGSNVPSTYWDLGVRGDTGPGNHTSTFTIVPTYSSLTNAAENAGTTNFVGATFSNADFTSQYCNGSRTPPEAGGYAGWQVPPGISDATVPNPIFNLSPAATVDEGNNWVNISWGPLALTNPVTGATLGNYAPAAGSPAIDAIPSVEHLLSGTVPTTDFFGNPRPDVKGSKVDIGAVEYQSPQIAVGGVSPASLAFGSVTDGTTSAAQTLTLSNTGAANLTGITVTVTAPFARPAAGGTCGAVLAGGATCTINVVFSPAAAGAVTGTVTIAGNVPVTGSPVALSGTGVAVVRTVSVTPSPLAFGNWATGTASNAHALTVTNTGNAALTGATVAGFTAPFARATGGAAGSCTGAVALPVGGSCTINVVFAPTATGSFTDNVTVTVAGATVTPTPAVLTGTGVAGRATVSITLNPLTITLATGSLTGTGTVTLTNTAPATGAQIAITGDSVSGGTVFSYFFNAVAGADTCVGTALAPEQSCTVGVRFTNVGSARGTNRAGSVSFTDSGAGSPQTGTLTGFATP